MSSPNEPGYPRTGDRPSGGTNGSAGPGPDAGSPAASSSRPGPSHATTSPAPAPERGDVPPWQRGPSANRATPPQRTAPEPQPPRPEGPRPAGPPTGPTGGAAGMDDRLNRFIAGGPAPVAEQDSPPTPTRNERIDTGRSEAYASELPDLSGPSPRPPQRKPVPERPAPEPPARAAAPTTRVEVGARSRGGPVRASMQIRRIDPWSTLKVSLVLSVALFFVWMIAVAFLYLVLGGMGVWSKLNSNVGDLLTSASGSTGGELVSSGTIFGGAALIGLVNIVILTAMATVAAFVYNLTTDLVGGVEVTLADRD